MISVRDLTKQFGRFRAVDDLSFTVAPGEAVALWGANGAGKTTVIRCVLGLLRHRGSIAVNGIDIRRDGRAARAMVGYVPQELAFHDDMRLMETLHFFAKLRRVHRALPGDRPQQVLEEVGLAGHGRKRIRELSGGMKQRMALALALLSDPPLLILDELTSNLDTSAQQQFMQLLCEQKAKGRTVLFTSHHLDEVETLADRVIVLEAGRLKLDCPPNLLASALGLRGRLHVFVVPDRLDEAVSVLGTRGYVAQRNGVSLSVDVALNEKAGPIQALAEASIAVRDFDFTSARERRPS